LKENEVNCRLFPIFILGTKQWSKFKPLAHAAVAASNPLVTAAPEAGQCFAGAAER